MNKTLWKYFIKELVPNFIMGFAAFLFVFFMTQILKLSDLIVVHSVGLKEVLRLITFVLLPFVGMTFPVALLFSVLISLGRMWQDSELIAMRAGGISLSQILKPILFFSIIICLCSGVFTIFIESWGFRSLKKLVFDIGQSKISTGIQPGLFNEDFYNLVIYTDRIDRENEKMEHILLYDERERERPLTVIAKNGRVISDPEDLLITLRLFDGNILIHEKKKRMYRKIDFDRDDINIELAPGGQFSIGDPRALSPAKLLAQIQAIREQNNRPTRELIEFHKRFAIPLACIIFAIFSTGIAGSTKNPRFSTGKGKAIVVSMIIIICYWILSLMGQSLAGKEVLPAQVVMWIPNLIFLALSVVVFKMALRRT